jgi:outer membrane protein insertion porin family
MHLLLILLLLDAPAQSGPPQVPATIPAAPVSTVVGRTIVRAEVVIDGQISADTALLGFVETRPGTPLSMFDVRETIAHLFSLGRYQEIFADASAEAGGVVVRFNVVPVDNIERIEFRGSVNLDTGDLRRTISDRFGNTPPASRASNVAELLQNYYFDRGYPAAAIRPVIERQPARTVLTFEIESGPRAFVRNVNLTGDPGEPRAAFLARIGASVGEPYQRVEVQTRLADYVERLRRRGRYEAQASHRVEGFIDDGRGVDLAVTIDAGPEIAVRFEGDPLPSNRIEELVPVRSEGSIDADIIEDSEARIAAYLREQGYWKATVSSERRERDGSLDSARGRQIEIVFRVNRGPKYLIAGGPQIAGNASISHPELQPFLAQLEEGKAFTAAKMDAAVSAILGVYQQRGFAQAKVESAPVEAPSPRAGEGRVTPRILITEGPQMIIGQVTLSGNTSVTTEVLVSGVETRTGRRFFAPEVLQDRDRILTALLNRGFASASVETSTNVVDGSRVDVTFAISEGPQSIIDHILVVGNSRIEKGVIEREVALKSGEPLGLDGLFETRRRLAALGLFRSVRIREIPHGDSNRRDLVIEVEEAPATTVGYGGGLEIDTGRLVEGAGGDAETRTEVAPRGFFEIGRRNLGGRNRSANLYTRLSLRSDAEEGGSSFGFPEYRVVATYREPRTFGWNADVTITGAVEQGVRSTFNFARKGVNAEIQRRLFESRRSITAGSLSPAPSYRLTGRYTFSTTRTFDERLTEEEQLTIDRIFPQVRLSAFSSGLARDTRDDLIDPSRGTFLSAEGTVAARALGGQVGFIKTFLQANAYRRLPGRRRIVLAGRIAVGLADGFPRPVTVEEPDGTVTESIIEDLPASERFYTGGESTIRGFALDSVGAPNTITEDGFPIGGNGLILANAELRVPVFGSVAAAFFIDGGNVFERVTQIDLGELRGSVGFGVRYGSPIGPLRLDLGFKLDQRPTDPDGRRYALHFSFGHAF